MTCMLIYVFSQLQHNRSPSLILKQWYHFSLETLPCEKCVQPFLSSREQGEIMERSGVNEVSGQIFQPV